MTHHYSKTTHLSSLSKVKGMGGFLGPDQKGVPLEVTCRVWCVHVMMGRYEFIHEFQIRVDGG